MIGVERTIISQYSASSTIVQLIRNMDENIDPTANFDDFYNFVWNVETAQGFGLDIWGRIVGVGRALTIPGTQDYFGFDEASPGSEPFGVSPFYNGIPPETETYFLADDAYRLLILAKAMANISATTAKALNQILQNIFSESGTCFVRDLGGMKMQYVFLFALSPLQRAIVDSGVLPTPAGVQYSVLSIPEVCFGFAEAGGQAQPFDQGVFFRG